MDALTLIQLVAAKRRIILLFAAISAFCAFLLGLFVVSYESSGQLIIRPVGTKSINAEEWLSPGILSSVYADNVRHEGITYIAVLRSREITERVVDQLNLQKRYEAPLSKIVDIVKQPLRALFFGRFPAIRKTPREKAVEQLRKSIRAILISGSSVLQVSAKHRNANKVSAIVNALMDTAVDFSAEQNKRIAIRVAELMETKLKTIRIERAELVAQLELLRTTHDIKSNAAIASQISELSQRIILIEQKLEEDLSSLPVVKQRLKDLRNYITKMPAHNLWSYTIDGSPQLQSLWQNLLAQKLELINEQIDFQSNSTQITARKEQIAMLEKAIQDVLKKVIPAETFQADPNREQLTLSLISAEISAVSMPLEIENMQQRIVALHNRISHLNTVYEAFNSLEKDIDSLTGAEAKMQTVLYDARTMFDVNLSEYKILNRAITPRYPSINKIPLAFYVFFAAFMGGFIGIFYILGHDRRLSGKRNL